MLHLSSIFSFALIKSRLLFSREEIVHGRKGRIYSTDCHLSSNPMSSMRRFIFTWRSFVLFDEGNGKRS